MTDSEIWRAVAYMLDLYGDDAAFQAALYADKLLELGDHDGFRTWTEVARAIEELSRRAANGPVN